MIQNFEYLIVFTSAPGVLPEQNDQYRIQPWKVNEIKAYKNTETQGKTQKAVKNQEGSCDGGRALTLEVSRTATMPQHSGTP